MFNLLPGEDHLSVWDFYYQTSVKAIGPTVASNPKNGARVAADLADAMLAVRAERVKAAKEKTQQ